MNKVNNIFLIVILLFYSFLAAQTAVEKIITNDENNPNGALKNIAGIFSKKKNILGMMPHPERMIDKYLSSNDGNFFFENLFENLK